MENDQVRKKMEFWITKASSSDNKTKPCKNAHMKKNEYGAKLWYVNINTLDELAELIKEVGPLIIYLDEITIYDAFVE